MTVATDGIVGIDALEDAALAFARTAPAKLVADAVESMIESLVDAVCGPCGMPIDDDDQISATLAEPWTVLFDLIGDLNPSLIVVDGEEELSTLAAETFPAVAAWDA